MSHAPSIDKLEKMLASADREVRVQAAELIEGLADPDVDRWILDKVELERSGVYRFDDPRWCAPSHKYGRAPLRLSKSQLRMDRIFRLLERARARGAMPARLSSVESLVVGMDRFGGHWPSPLDPRPLAAFSGLKSVYIAAGDENRAPTPIVDLSPLLELERLEELVLSTAKDVDLTPLAGSASLRVLRLDNVGCTGLDALASSSLEALSIVASTVGPITRLPSTLRELVLDRYAGGDLPFGDAGALTTLVVRSDRPLSLAGIDGCQQLRVVDLRGADAGDLAALAKIPSLVTVALDSGRAPKDRLPAALADVVSWAAEPDVHLLAAWGAR